MNPITCTRESFSGSPTADTIVCSISTGFERTSTATVAGSTCLTLHLQVLAGARPLRSCRVTRRGSAQVACRDATAGGASGVETSTRAARSATRERRPGTAFLKQRSVENCFIMPEGVRDVDAPHRISRRRSARLLRLPLEGGVIGPSNGPAPISIDPDTPCVRTLDVTVSPGSLLLRRFAIILNSCGSFFDACKDLISRLAGQ